VTEERKGKTERQKDRKAVRRDEREHSEAWVKRSGLGAGS